MEEGADAAHLLPMATPITDQPTSMVRTIDHASTATPTTDPRISTAPTIARVSPTAASIVHGSMAGAAGDGEVGVGADGGAGSSHPVDSR